MKKIISLFLAVCMILALSACGNSGSTGGSGASGEPDATNKQPQPTNATTAATEPATEPTTEPITEPVTEPVTEPADPYSVAYGTWYEQNGQVASLNEDGTFVLNGETYTYAFEEIDGTSIRGMVYDGDTELYILRITQDSDYGYHTLLIRPADKSGQHTGSQNTGFYNRDEFDVIEMTLDNWEQYFDLSNEPEFTLDENGNVTDFDWDAYLVLKEELTTCFNISTVVFSCKSTYADHYVTIDIEKQTVTVGDPVSPDADPNVNDREYLVPDKMHMDSVWRYGSYVGHHARFDHTAQSIPILEAFEMYAISGELWLVKNTNSD